MIEPVETMRGREVLQEEPGGSFVYLSSWMHCPLILQTDDEKDSVGLSSHQEGRRRTVAWADLIYLFVESEQFRPPDIPFIFTSTVAFTFTMT